ncbi:ABC transporter ATP-binding protein [Methanobrevibacter boviskoreani]|uniref:ABC transporter ATP-binding protein n=1 Tax=Methanobrevibacter boviskoreani TaxID=1348249 RepID=UPI000A6A1A70|nr:ABC transporter ATP-binding protein [Methanobrevibacter boviskoreani]
MADNNKLKTYLFGHDVRKLKNEKAIYNVILVDENGNPLKDEDIVLNVFDVDYKRKTKADGFSTLNINLSFPADIVVNYEGNDKYLPSSTENTISIDEPDVKEIERKKRIKAEQEAKIEADKRKKREEHRKKFPVSDEVAINVDHVSMEFDLAKEKVDNIKEYVIKKIKREIKPKTKFRALDDVTFKINKGERLGVVGFNGAGKSTLLKILSGVMKPTKGTVSVDGKVAPLLELGAGFDYNFTGQENIFLNGAILGYRKEFLEEKYDEIVEFSELGEFIEIPVKNYSSGMKAKLGFSVATIVQPEILILDEVLSVGDIKFQEKSRKKIESLMSEGVTVILVSHNTNTIRSICNKAVWLDHGKLVEFGDVEDVCDHYVASAKNASKAQLKNLKLN